MAKPAVSKQELLSKFKTLEIAIIDYQLSNNYNTFWKEVDIMIYEKINEDNAKYCKDCGVLFG